MPKSSADFGHATSQAFCALERDAGGGGDNEAADNVLSTCDMLGTEEPGKWLRSRCRRLQPVGGRCILLRASDMQQVLRSLAEGCGLDEGARSLSLGLEQQHSSSEQNGALQSRESMDGATPQFEQLQVWLPDEECIALHAYTSSVMCHLGPACLGLDRVHASHECVPYTLVDCWPQAQQYSSSSSEGHCGRHLRFNDLCS